MTVSDPHTTLIAPVDDGMLSRMVRFDQLVMVRRSLLAAFPSNMVLSIAATLVAASSGYVRGGLCWLALSVLVNLLRRSFLQRPLPTRPGGVQGRDLQTEANTRSFERQLRATAFAAAVAGGLWALIPLLCEGYTSPQTLFYMTLVCGICAGSVAYGTAYAKVPICFIAPPLLSVAGCLAYAGGFDNRALAVLALLYLAGLSRASMHGEKTFRLASRRKNEATAMTAQLLQAHDAMQKSAHQLVFRASHDALTGLLNREGFSQRATQYIAAAPGCTHCLLLLDLDGFKTVNDAFGHKAGDRVLQDVGAWLRHELHVLQPVLGRWGGDEFAALYTVRDPQQAPTAVAGALIRSIPGATAHYGGHLGVSIGVMISGAAEVSGIADMIAVADEALYDAKRAGRNRFQVVDEALHKRLAMRRDVERDLLHAIQAREICVWYQPIVDAVAHKVHSIEALLRWNHPRHGWISPEQVVFAAAGTGLAEKLLRHILGDICLAMRTLEDAGSDLAQVPIAMNVSPREMAQLTVDEIVLGTLRQHGIAHDRLQIEITEEVALDTPATRSRLGALSVAGIFIAIDDFGVGYSSLSSLRGDHVKQIKIDRSFISDLGGSTENRVLVNSIVQVGHALNVEVVAEGVETQDELDALRALGCELMQGYHFARPATLADVMRWSEAAFADGPASVA
ncbi:MAG: putative bifunctional diguanylate cyclase/phosphodiesterase [Janthinobacterium lividum]